MTGQAEAQVVDHNERTHSMETRWEKLSTPAGLGILTTFLSFLFFVSAGGRSDGRGTPFPAGVLNDPGCCVTGCHMDPGNPLHEFNEA